MDLYHNCSLVFKYKKFSVYTSRGRPCKFAIFFPPPSDNVFNFSVLKSRSWNAETTCLLTLLPYPLRWRFRISLRFKFVSKLEQVCPMIKHRLHSENGAADRAGDKNVGLIALTIQHNFAMDNVPGGGALPLWRWRGCKAPKTPYFQRCCHPMTPYFCWLSLLSSKDLKFFGEMWAL